MCNLVCLVGFASSTVCVIDAFPYSREDGIWVWSYASQCVVRSMTLLVSNHSYPTLTVCQSPHVIQVLSSVARLASHPLSFIWVGISIARENYQHSIQAKQSDTLLPACNPEAINQVPQFEGRNDKKDNQTNHQTRSCTMASRRSSPNFRPNLPPMRLLLITRHLRLFSRYWLWIHVLYSGARW